MERKIGEIFKYDNDWYQCIEGVCGKDCSLYGNSLRKTIADITEQAFGVCNSNHRSDDKSVIFKKLEKVGEPFERDGYMYQEYKAHTYPLLMSGGAKIPTDNGFAVIIKQNKEDMEGKTIKIKKEDIKVGNKVIYLPSNRPYVITEANCRMKYDGDWHDCVIYTPLYDNPYKCFVRPIKDFAQNFVLNSAEEKEEKHSNLENTGKNLKPFDLEAAKAGKPVCTRDGRKARIICFDRNDLYPIVALIECEDGKEIIGAYSLEGQTEIYEIKGTNLMMLPEKKEGWAVIRRSDIYETEEQAKEVLLNSKVGVMIRKIEWVE